MAAKEVDAFVADGGKQRRCKPTGSSLDRERVMALESKGAGGDFRQRRIGRSLRTMLTAR